MKLYLKVAVSVLKELNVTITQMQEDAMKPECAHSNQAALWMGLNT